MTRLTRALVIGAAISIPAGAIAEERAHPVCEAIVRPIELSAHSRHPWRNAPGIRLADDIAVCAYYQDEVPAGFSFSVSNDAQRREFDSARHSFNEVHAARDLGDAYYVRLAATAPFEPSWGLIVHDGARTYRVEGIPEAGNAAAAQKLAREMMERAMKVF